MLAYYYERFDTVELNNSFYRLPIPSALSNWRDSTPEGFCFAAKGSRFLTHMKKLKDPEQGLERFFGALDVLGDKLGPVLFQLPPNWELDFERLAYFLKVLPQHHRYAFEFRNPTWNVQKVYELLSHYRTGYCIFDLAGFQSPIEVTTDLVYIRLHGPGGKYQGSYSREALSEWSRRIRKWQHESKTVYIYFDNDQAGYAAHNALQLKELVK